MDLLFKEPRIEVKLGFEGDQDASSRLPAEGPGSGHELLLS